MSNLIEIESWINDALAVLQISNRNMEMAEAEQVFSATQRRFVSGSPRVWWLGFAHVRSSHPSETIKLSALANDPDALGWFIPETEGSGSIVYRLTAEEAEAVVADCPFFEYYFLDAQEHVLIAETDHNQFVIAAPLSDSPPSVPHG